MDRARTEAFVNVAGRYVRVVRSAPLAAGKNVPIFFIEAACGWYSSMYGRVIDGLARHGHVIAYDRAGLGRSTPAADPPDATARASELFSLNEAMNLKGPFVLVGHSIAALYLRVYAHQHPKNVASLVLLDPTHHLVYAVFTRSLQKRERMQTLLASLACRFGVKRQPVPLLRANEPPWDSLPREAREDIIDCSADPQVALTERAELANLEVASRQAEAAGNIEDIPLLVISSGSRSLRELKGFRHPEAFMKLWLLLQRDFATLSKRSEHLVVESAGHCDLVTDERHAGRICEHIVEFVNRQQANSGTRDV